MSCLALCATSFRLLNPLFRPCVQDIIGFKESKNLMLSWSAFALPVLVQACMNPQAWSGPYALICQSIMLHLCNAGQMPISNTPRLPCLTCPSKMPIPATYLKKRFVACFTCIAQKTGASQPLALRRMRRAVEPANTAAEPCGALLGTSNSPPRCSPSDLFG